MAGMSTQRGRPRDPGVDDAVRAAVLELLAEGGYDAVSFQRVAARAGVGQPTVYRRWATKAELVEAAVFAVAEWAPPPRKGQLGEDLRALGEVIVEGMLQPVVRSAMPGLLLAYDQDRGGHARLRAWAEAPVHDAFVDVVENALPPGTVADRRQLDPLFDVFLAGLVFPAMTREADEARACVVPVVEVIEHAIAATWPAGSRRPRRLTRART